MECAGSAARLPLGTERSSGSASSLKTFNFGEESDIIFFGGREDDCSSRGSVYGQVSREKCLIPQETKRNGIYVVIFWLFLVNAVLKDILFHAEYETWGYLPPERHFKTCEKAFSQKMNMRWKWIEMETSVFENDPYLATIILVSTLSDHFSVSPTHKHTHWLRNIWPHPCQRQDTEAKSLWPSGCGWQTLWASTHWSLCALHGCYHSLNLLEPSSAVGHKLGIHICLSAFRYRRT